MKKEVAKVFKKHGENKIEIIRGYRPVATGKKEATTAIKGARKDINVAIGNILLEGDKQERKLVGKTLIGDYFEDWDSENKLIIKY